MEIGKVTETSLQSDSINNNITAPQDTIINVPMAQELDLKDDMTGLEVEKSDTKVKINNPDEISTASIAETIAADATDINSDNIKHLVGLSTSYDTPELNEASEALSNLQNKEDMTAEFLYNDMEKGTHVRAEEYNQYDKDNDSMSSVIGGSAIVTHTSKDNKFGVFGGFTFKSSVKVNENEQSTDNDTEIPILITDDDGDLDLSTVTTEYLAQTAEKETSYGAFLMAKGDVGDYIIGGGASLNKIDDKLMTQVITAGILDKDRNIALSLIRNDYTTFTPEGKDKSGRTNFKLTFLPLKSKYEPKEADAVKLNDGIGITNLSKIHNDVEQGLHIDIESEGDKYDDEDGLCFRYPMQFESEDKSRNLVLTPLAGAYNVKTDEDDANLCKLKAGVTAEFNAVTKNGWYITSDFKAIDECTTDFDSNKRNVFYTSLQNDIQRITEKGNKIALSADAGYVLTGDVKVAYGTAGVGFTSGNVVLKGELAASKLSILDNAFHNLTAGFRAILKF